MLIHLLRYIIFQIFPSILIFLAAYPLFTILNKTGDYCYIGILAIFLILYGFLFIFIFLCVLAFHLLQFFKKKKPFNYFPIISLIIIMIYFKLNLEDKPKKFIEESDLILFNLTGDMDKENYLYLTNEGEYLFVQSYVHAKCYDFGKYYKRNDSLIFDEYLIAFSDTLLDKRYFLDKKNYYYRPMTDSCSENKFLRFKK